MKIAALVFDKITVLDIVGPVEVLSWVPGVEIVWVGKQKGAIRAAPTGLAMTVEKSIDEVKDADIVVVPGGPGVRLLLKDEPVLGWLRDIHAKTQWTTSVCTGSLLLGAAGLLKGLDATTHWNSVPVLESFGARYREQRVIPQGKIVTVDIDARHWKQSMEKLSIVGKDQLLQRILFLEGDSTSPEIVKQAAQYIPANGRVLVTLDSLHTREHVLKEPLAYADLVSPDSSLIVNYTQLEGWYRSDKMSAPRLAITEFLAPTDRFQIDPAMNKFYVSCARDGFLKRVK